MQLHDLPRVLEIEQQSFDTPWTEGMFKDCLEYRYECDVLEIDNLVVGFIIAQIIAAECHLYNICIEPVSKGQGLGEYLLRHLINLAKKKQAKEILLEVRESNARAQKLYYRLHFIEIGLRRNYYPSPSGGENAILFKLILD